MSRQLDKVLEERRQKRDRLIVAAIEYELSAAVSFNGAELVGLAVKFRGGDCLVVIKAVLAGRPQVAFVEAEDLGSALIKVCREGRQDRLRWREDKYGGET